MAFTGKVHKVGAHIDTDAIIPARFLVTTDARKLGENCMEGLEHGWVNRVQEGDILVAERNFGCGSSREHAPWALTDYGFKVVIAPSFADIFYGNSFNNQLLPVTLSEEQVDELFKLVQSQPGIKFEVDLQAEVVKAGDKSWSFKIDAFRRHCMLNGLDSIGLTLQHEEAISAYEKKLPAFMN